MAEARPVRRRDVRVGTEVAPPSSARGPDSPWPQALSCGPRSGQQASRKRSRSESRAWRASSSCSFHRGSLSRRSAVSRKARSLSLTASRSRAVHFLAVPPLRFMCLSASATRASRLRQSPSSGSPRVSRKCPSRVENTSPSAPASASWSHAADSTSHGRTCSMAAATPVSSRALISSAQVGGVPGSALYAASTSFRRATIRGRWFVNGYVPISRSARDRMSSASAASSSASAQAVLVSNSASSSARVLAAGSMAASTGCSLRIRLHSEWMVPMTASSKWARWAASSGRLITSLRTRSRISEAAASVKVTAAIWGIEHSPRRET